MYTIKYPEIKTGQQHHQRHWLSKAFETALGHVDNLMATLELSQLQVTYSVFKAKKSRGNASHSRKLDFVLSLSSQRGIKKETQCLGSTVMRLILIVLLDFCVTSPLWGVLNLRCLQGEHPGPIDVQWVVAATGLRQKREHQARDGVFLKSGLLAGVS